MANKAGKTKHLSFALATGPPPFTLAIPIVSLRMISGRRR